MLDLVTHLYRGHISGVPILFGWSFTSSLPPSESREISFFLLCTNWQCCQGLYIPSPELQCVVWFSNPGEKKSKSAESWEVSLENYHHTLALFLSLFF